jgi:hypothetical protein
MENIVNKSIPTQWIGAADNEPMQRVQQWLAEGRTLAWLPIWSRENFPNVPPQVLYAADQCPERHVWLINTVEDFLQIPDGITGWLLPKGDKDTDIVVGLWNDTLHFLKVVDKRTGEPQTLKTGKTWEEVDPSSNEADVVRI